MSTEFPPSHGAFRRVAIVLLTMLLAHVTAAQTIRLESVPPAATDPAITGWFSAHAAAFDPLADRRGQLMVYLHGQGGTGSGAGLLLQTAAQAGYHAVGLTYANDWTPFSLCSGTSDPACAENIRREILDGVDRSPLITVSTPNSVINRLVKLLIYLDARHPGEDWGTFIDAATQQPRWDRIVVWGHSQGGGNAGVLARYQALARVCLSAPAADGGPGSPAPWWATHATASEAYFGLCHVQDALSVKLIFWSALGMDPFGPVIDVATSISPYFGTHRLSTSIAPAVAGQFHNSVVMDAVTPRLADGSPAYASAWRYMLTAPIVGAPGAAPSRDDQIFARAATTTGETDLMLDIYGATTGSGPRPVLVWIHGGGWQSGSHNQTPAFALDLRARGITVVSIGYRLTDQVVFPAQLHDCKGAIRWLRAHASELQIDPSRIAVWGSSAGGHLAALVTTSGNTPALEGSTGGNAGFSSAVIGGAVYFGPTDILQMQPDCAISGVVCSTDHDASSSPESKLLGVSLAGQGIGWLRANADNPIPPFPELAARAAAANPITHLDLADPPLFIAHGDDDRVVPLNQGFRLRNAAIEAGIPVSMTVAPGFGHGSLGDAVNVSSARWVETLLLTTPVCVTIQAQPASAQVRAGLNVTLAIAASGTPPPAFRWRRSGTPIDTISNPSAATAALTLTSVTAASAGTYDCIITNPCGTVTSRPATISILPGLPQTCSLADIAGSGTTGLEPDGIVDGSDFIAFINSFSVGDRTIDPLADIAGGGPTGLSPDGIIDGTDFINFINAFSAGC